MSRLDQVNSLLRQELALAINRYLELDGVLVTVTDVYCSADLNEAKVLVSVLPEKLAGTALKQLKHISGELAHALRPRFKFKRMPVFHWAFDSREARAAQLEDVFNEVHEN
jgi:ribosome-binding factor A